MLSAMERAVSGSCIAAHGVEMITERQHRRTHLFTVRLWVESTEQDRTEVRGQVQRVLGGDLCYFRTWQELIDFFEDSLREVEKSAMANQ